MPSATLDMRKRAVRTSRESRGLRENMKSIRRGMQESVARG